MDKDQMKVSKSLSEDVSRMTLLEDIMGINSKSNALIVTGETYVDEAASYATEKDTVEWYWVKLPVVLEGFFLNANQHRQYVESVAQWCWDTFGSPQHHLVSSPGPVDARWTTLGSKFCFKHAEDRTAFVLKWS